jgi:hypothetical protein
MRRLLLEFQTNYLTSFFVNVENLLSDLIRLTSTIVAVQAGFGASRMSAEWSARSSLGNNNFLFFILSWLKLLLFFYNSKLSTTHCDSVATQRL